MGEACVGLVDVRQCRVRGWAMIAMMAMVMMHVLNYECVVRRVVNIGTFAFVDCVSPPMI